MKRVTKLFFGIAMLCIAVLACKDQKKEPGSTEAGAEQVEQEAIETSGTNEMAANATVLDANLATEAELSAIGLPQDVVEKIVEKRPFMKMNEFDALLGSMEGKSALYQKIFVPFNLNTTPEADFKMIPGVGDRMAHEFDEYRPYTSIQQFRREIGKYVDEEEVARYENYVYVPVELNTASEEDIKALPGVGDRMAHEFMEYRPYSNMEQFRREIGKYVDDKELARLEGLVYLSE